MRRAMTKARGFWPAAAMLAAVLVVLGTAGSGNLAGAASGGWTAADFKGRYVGNFHGWITADGILLQTSGIISFDADGAGQVLITVKSAVSEPGFVDATVTMPYSVDPATGRVDVEPNLLGSIPYDQIGVRAYLSDRGKKLDFLFNFVPRLRIFSLGEASGVANIQ